MRFEEFKTNEVRVCDCCGSIYFNKERVRRLKIGKAEITICIYCINRLALKCLVELNAPIGAVHVDVGKLKEG